jgi:outer membrane lipoprotein-sorting protein
MISARARLVLLLLLLWAGNAQAQDRGEGELDAALPKGMTAEQIIQRFTAKEKEVQAIRREYTFRQSIKVHTLDHDGKSVSEYQLVADIHYDPKNQWIPTVVFAPQPSLKPSKEDLADLETRQSFTVGSDELPLYNVTYVGQQRLDELHCYAFDVAPKQIEKGQRYFQGRIWVDDHDFQIVRNTGKSVPDIRIQRKKRVDENLFPKFTTWREQIDGKYWFPTFSSADDTLHFVHEDVHIKELLKFTDYKRVGAAR